MKRVFHVLAWLALAINVAALLLAICWLVRPYKTTEIKTPIQILNENKEIAAGEKIILRMVIDKYTLVKPRVDVYIKCNDFNLVGLTSAMASRPIGHYEFINEAYTLPNGLLSGSLCTITFNNAYKVNPMRTITKVWTSEEFMITERIGNGTH